MSNPTCANATFSTCKYDIVLLTKTFVHARRKQSEAYPGGGGGSARPFTLIRTCNAEWLMRIVALCTRSSSTFVRILGLTQEGGGGNISTVLPDMRTLGCKVEERAVSCNLCTVRNSGGTEAYRMPRLSNFRPCIVSFKKVVRPKPYRPYRLRRPCCYMLQGYVNCIH